MAIVAYDSKDQNESRVEMNDDAEAETQRVAVLVPSPVIFHTQIL